MESILMVEIRENNNNESGAIISPPKETEIALTISHSNQENEKIAENFIGLQENLNEVQIELDPDYNCQTPIFGAMRDSACGSDSGKGFESKSQTVANKSSKGSSFLLIPKSNLGCNLNPSQNKSDREAASQKGKNFGSESLKNGSTDERSFNDNIFTGAMNKPREKHPFNQRNRAENRKLEVLESEKPEKKPFELGENLNFDRFPSGAIRGSLENRKMAQKYKELDTITKKIEIYDRETQKHRGKSQERVKISEIAENLVETTKNQKNKANIEQLLKGGSLKYRDCPRLSNL